MNKEQYYESIAEAFVKLDEPAKPIIPKPSASHHSEKQRKETFEKLKRKYGKTL